MSFQDKTITCFDCSQSFTFTVAEQEQFQAKGYTNAPKRCPACRQARKADRPDSRNDSFGNSTYGSNSARSGGYGSTSPRQMFPAVCSDCGKATTVPFEPRQGKPVRCSDCYRKVQVNR